MTSDAKIGLLLGFAFIIVIAFVINGLPSFQEDKNSNELTTNMVGLDNNPPGLAAKERKAGREVITRIGSVQKQAADKVRMPSATDNQDIRFKMPLPKSPHLDEEIVKSELTTTKVALPAAKEKQSRRFETKKPTLPKVYLVKEYDCLATIAQKFYGPDEGNKTINVARIFEANRGVLNSPHEIYIGQKLIIPPLPGAHRAESKAESIFPATEFMKIESIGKRHLSASGSKAKKGGKYVVREGDSLWRIAAKQLGDATRYDEIADINADILDDEDSLTIGMRLRLPTR